MTKSDSDVISLYPEQVRAMDYLRLKGTVAPLAQLRSQIQAAFDKLESVIASVPPGLRQVAPADRAWTIHEILDHVVVCHEWAVRELRGLIAGTCPEGEPIPPGLVSAAPFETSWRSLEERLHSMHRDFLDAVNAADERVSLEVRAPVVMVVKVPGADGKPTPVAWTYDLDWKAYAQAFRVHTLEHVEQINRTLAAIHAKG